MNKKPITMFIHGTLPPQTLLDIPLVKRFFHSPEGITALSELTDSHIKDILTTLCSSYPEEYPQEHCYTFGWSGTLSHKARQKAGESLYKKLLTLKKRYLQQGIEPVFTLLTHSHGGNVALCLKNGADKFDDDELTIDELVMLACPVQCETADYIHDELFKNIYSIHSHKDLLQVLDPQGLHIFFERLKAFGLELTLSNLKQLGPLFSERHFSVNSKVKQLSVKYPHRELFHIEFILPAFIEALPKLTKQLRNQPSSDTEHTYIFKQE